MGRDIQQKDEGKGEREERRVEHGTVLFRETCTFVIHAREARDWRDPENW
jgi:hypothetical protein